MANAPIGPILSGRINRAAEHIGVDALTTYIASPRSANGRISKDHLRKLVLHDETSISDELRHNILTGLEIAWLDNNDRQEQSASVIPAQNLESNDVVKINNITIDIELSNGTHVVGPIKQVTDILKAAIR